MTLYHVERNQFYSMSIASEDCSAYLHNVLVVALAGVDMMFTCLFDRIYSSMRGN